MFSNETIICGKRNDEHKAYFLSGHWKLESAIRYARNRGLNDRLEITHAVRDGSGKGRGGHDGKWTVSADGGITQVEKWVEGRVRTLPDGRQDDEGDGEDEYLNN